MRGLKLKYLFLINKLVTFTEVKINEMNINILIQALFITLSDELIFLNKYFCNVTKF